MSDSARANYFDNAATTPLDPTALAEMLPYLEDDFGNANSIHAWGQRAHAAVETARQHVADLLRCAPEEVVFTSGATESNNWILKSFSPVTVSPFEHSSVWETAKTLGNRTLANDGYKLFADPEAELVSVMLVNNETGAVLTPPPTKRLHRDVTQALGKLPIDLTGVGYASMSAHKLYGPKGVGALYIRNAVPLGPLLNGGEQEDGLRAGTLNVPAIVGFGTACRLASERMESDLHHVQSLREAVQETLSKVTDYRDNSSESNSPYILSVSFLGVEGETLVVEADAKGYAVSSGAACSSRSNEPSHVLTALGIEPEWLRGTVRVSFSRWNTEEAARDLAKAIAGAVEKLRSRGK